VKMEGLISIIVPVYKAEKYLARCIHSILSQQYHNWELLLIDDGSPDRSGVLCDEFAKSDSRIKAFHKQNGGVSSARQYGLDHSQGEYIIHVDPDDWIEGDMLSTLYSTAKCEDADMVICDFYWDGDPSFISKQKPEQLNSTCVLNSFFDGTMHASCCNKLVRKATIDKYNITFPLELSLYEDLFFNSSLLMHDIRIAYCPSAFYHYDVCI
ncbi:group 2 family glycosyl transferase, partial [gut metagenome]